jgi:hypothetical protein
VWAGNRGVLFEWDGLQTTYRPVNQRPNLIGLSSLGGLYGVSDRAAVTERIDGGWVAPQPAPPEIESCDRFLSTLTLDFVGCRLVDGGPGIYAIGPSHALSPPEPIDPLGVPCHGVTAFGQIGGLPAALVCPPAYIDDDAGYRGERLVVRRGGRWTPATNDDRAIPAAPMRVLFELQGRTFRSHYALEWLLPDGGWGPPRWDAPRRFETSLVLSNGQAVLAGDELVWLKPDGGLDPTLLPDGGGLQPPRSQATKVAGSVHARAWNALAELPEGVLAVGAFGATAVFPFDGGPGQLASSPVALRFTDICGTLDGTQLYATTSAADGVDLGSSRGTMYRPYDGLIRGTPEDNYGGVMSTTNGLVWAPMAADAGSGSGLGADPAVDQCSVSSTGELSIINAEGVVTLLAGGTRRFAIATSPNRVYSGLWTSGVAGLASLAGSNTVMGFDTSLTTLTLQNAEGCTPYGLGAYRMCAGRGLDVSFNGGSFTSQGSAERGLHARSSANNATQVWWYVKQPGSVLTSFSAPVETAEAMTILQTGQSAPSIWVDETLRPWILISATQGTASVAQSVRLQQTMSTVSSIPLPPTAWTESASAASLNLWGTPTALYVQTPFGLFRRPR